MPKNETQPQFRVTERRQFQFDILDELIAKRERENLSPVEKYAIDLQIQQLKATIAVQGGDVGEFEYPDSWH